MPNIEDMPNDDIESNSSGRNSPIISEKSPTFLPPSSSTSYDPFFELTNPLSEYNQRISSIC